MKKVILSIFAVLFIASIGYSQVTTLWEKSATAGTKPVWETGSLTRGIGYGLVGGNDLFFVVTRNADLGGKQIIYYNALTGDSLGQLDNTGIVGGVAIVNDVEVSSDGKIFVANMTTNASADAFKVYRYDSISAAPVEVISYNAAAERLGDKFTVSGSTADNSIIIWVADGNANSGLVHKFTTTDNGNTFTPSTVDIGSPATASSVAIGPLSGESFYWNSHGNNASKYDNTGTLVGTIPGTALGTSGSAIRFMNLFSGSEFIAANNLLTTSNNATILKVPGGDPTLATAFGVTPVLGATSAGGLGDVSVQKVSDYIYNVYVLATNNGFGAYQVDLRTPLAGDFYIGSAGTGPGGSDPQFATLRDAFEVLNNSVFTGDCNFYITSDILETFTPAVGYGLGLAINPEPYTVTFKPYTGVQPVVTLAYPTDGTSGPSGALIIGVPMDNNIAWADLRATKNIVIDGSNTVGGTTRDLTIECATTAQRNAFPLTIVGDVSETVVKNTNIYYKAQGVSTSGNLFVSAIQLRSRSNSGVDFVPHNILFENNHISANFDGVVQSAQGYGTYQSGTPVPVLLPYNITLKNNLIEGKRRAVALYLAGSHDIIGNELILNQDIAANTTNEAIYAVNVLNGSVINIYNNRISKISSMTNAANNGNTAISIETFGTYNIYNNMIYGFELTAANPVAYLRGINNSSASATLNLNFNSIYLDNLADVGTGTVTYQGMLLSDGTNQLANNIVVSAEPDFASYCIYRSGTAGTVASDYNVFYPADPTNGNVGYWDAAATKSLTDWQTASGQDANSKSKQVFFVSTTDLHLTGSSNGDFDLAGTPIAGITTDIDGDTRSLTDPYKGADEASNPVPVELTAFSASYTNGSVLLKWTTATEINNQGFEIQRKSVGDFATFGFVKGNGTTTQVQSYSFTDNEVNNGTYSYRLKQVDFDGTFTYSNVIEVEITSPLTFSLSQNYPNPFNPTTKINYTVPFDSKVTIAVYSITGELVTELVNNNFAAGSYSVDFNGSNLASGMYIYKMTAGSFTQINKMMLMK